MTKETIEWAKQCSYVKAIDEENNKITFNNGSFLQPSPYDMLGDDEEASDFFILHLNVGGEIEEFCGVDFLDPQNIEINLEDIEANIMLSEVSDYDALVESLKLLNKVFGIHAIRPM